MATRTSALDRAMAAAIESLPDPAALVRLAAAPASAGTRAANRPAAEAPRDGRAARRPASTEPSGAG